MKPKPRFTTPSTNPRRVPEWRMQAEAVSCLRKTGWPIRVAGDMNAGRRGRAAAAKAKATGMNPGEPDLRVYLPTGRIGLIEFKAHKGVLSDDQIDAHDELEALGHHVAVVESKTAEDAARQAVALVAGWLGLPANDNREGE